MESSKISWMRGELITTAFSNIKFARQLWHVGVTTQRVIAVPATHLRTSTCPAKRENAFASLNIWQCLETHIIMQLRIPTPPIVFLTTVGLGDPFLNIHGPWCWPFLYATSGPHSEMEEIDKFKRQHKSRIIACT